MKITTSFPGGNIVVDRIEDDTVYLQTDRRDTEGHWFYWSFQLSGAKGRTLQFIFDSSEGLCLTSRGPAISLDEGKSWKWLGAEHTGMPDEESFTLCPDSDQVRIAFCMPYQLEHWKQFSRNLPGSFQQTTLCTTAKGRDVPLLASVAKNNDTLPLILLTGRHHACESSSGYTLEGFIQAWGKKLARKARLAVIPFVDLDGVEGGDQGKNRRPHDHNRDYNPEPIYPEVAAIKQVVESQLTPFIALDLHCPYARNGDSETLYLVGSAIPRIEAQQSLLSQCLEAHASALPYTQANNIPFGTGWNTGRNYNQGMSFAGWCTQHAHCLLATTVEIPYANASGAENTPAALQDFGNSLAQALADYLSQHKLPGRG